MVATTLTAGSIYTYLVNSSGRMTLTPGGGGTITILSRDSSDDTAVPRSISAAETLPLRASSTISFQAVGVDATWEFFPFDSAENMAWVQSSVSGGSIFGAPKIRKMLGVIGQASFRRVNIGYHSHSIGVGVDATDAGAFTSTEFSAWHTKSQAAIAASLLSASVNGVGASAGIAMAGTGGAANPLVTMGGGASAPTFSTPVFGPGGWNATISAAGHTMAFTAVGTTIRVYSVASGNPSTVQARWNAPSVSAGATQTVAAAGTNPTPALDRTWYEFTISGVTPGETVTLMGPTAGSYRVYYIDLDYKPNTAGITVHRLCASGWALIDLHGSALDATDTAGNSQWTGSAASAGGLMRLGNAQSMSVRVPIDAAILQTDVNDLNSHATYNYSLADMKRHLANYLAYHASLSIPVLVVLGPIRDPSFSPGTRPYNQVELVTAYKEAISESTMAAYLDLTAEFGGATSAGFTEYQASGLLKSGDIVHPGSVGHGYYGAMIASALLNAARGG